MTPRATGWYDSCTSFKLNEIVTQYGVCRIFPIWCVLWSNFFLFPVGGSGISPPRIFFNHTHRNRRRKTAASPRKKMRHVDESCRVIFYVNRKRFQGQTVDAWVCRVHCRKYKVIATFFPQQLEDCALWFSTRRFGWPTTMKRSLIAATIQDGSKMSPPGSQYGIYPEPVADFKKNYWSWLIRTLA